MQQQQQQHHHHHHQQLPASDLTAANHGFQPMTICIVPASPRDVSGPCAPVPSCMGPPCGPSRSINGRDVNDGGLDQPLLVSDTLGETARRDRSQPLSGPNSTLGSELSCASAKAVRKRPYQTLPIPTRLSVMPGDNNAGWIEDDNGSAQTGVPSSGSCSETLSQSSCVSRATARTSKCSRVSETNWRKKSGQTAQNGRRAVHRGVPLAFSGSLGASKRYGRKASDCNVPLHTSGFSILRPSNWHAPTVVEPSFPSRYFFRSTRLSLPGLTNRTRRRSKTEPGSAATAALEFGGIDSLHIPAGVSGAEFQLPTDPQGSDGGSFIKGDMSDSIDSDWKWLPEKKHRPFKDERLASCSSKSGDEEGLLASSINASDMGFSKAYLHAQPTNFNSAPCRAISPRAAAHPICSAAAASPSVLSSSRRSNPSSLLCSSFRLRQRWIAVLKRMFQDLAAQTDKRRRFIDKETFLGYFPLPGVLGERLFDLFDTDHSQSIDFLEFYRGLTIIYNGTVEDKKKFLFDMYDLDGNGRISRAELEALLSHVPAAFKILHDLASPAPWGANSEGIWDGIESNRDALGYGVSSWTGASRTGNCSVEKIFKMKCPLGDGLETPSYATTTRRDRENEFKDSAWQSENSTRKEGILESRSGCETQWCPRHSQELSSHLDDRVSQIVRDVFAKVAQSSDRGRSNSASTALTPRCGEDLSFSHLQGPPPPITLPTTVTSGVVLPPSGCGAEEEEGLSYSAFCIAWEQSAEIRQVLNLFYDIGMPDIPVPPDALQAETPHGGRDGRWNSTKLRHTTCMGLLSGGKGTGSLLARLSDVPWARTASRDSQSVSPTSSVMSNPAESSDLGFRKKLRSRFRSLQYISTATRRLFFDRMFRLRSYTHPSKRFPVEHLTATSLGDSPPPNFHATARKKSSCSSNASMGDTSGAFTANGDRADEELPDVFERGTSRFYSLPLSSFLLDTSLTRDETLFNLPECLKPETFHLELSPQRAASTASRARVVLSGWLFKVGKRFKWRHNRFFVLRDRFLYYFNSPRHPTPKKALFIQGAQVQPICVTDRKSAFPFEILLPGGRVHRLFARTKEERDNWVRALSRATRSANLHDDYLIEEPCGRGKFAVVHKGMNKRTGHLVAIKIIPKVHIQLVRKEFLRTEVSVMRLLRHPNVTSLVDVYDTVDYLYLAMEWVSGGDLGRLATYLRQHTDHRCTCGLWNNTHYRELKARRVSKDRQSWARYYKRSSASFETDPGKPLGILITTQLVSERLTLIVARGVLMALTCLHRRNIVHRDLKPENVLLVVSTEEDSLFGAKQSTFSLLDNRNAQIKPPPTTRGVSRRTTCHLPRVTSQQRWTESNLFLPWHSSSRLQAQHAFRTSEQPDSGSSLFPECRRWQTASGIPEARLNSDLHISPSTRPMSGKDSNCIGASDTALPCDGPTTVCEPSPQGTASQEHNATCLLVSSQPTRCVCEDCVVCTALRHLVNVKITDFGLSKILSPSALANEQLGTLSYAAPEVVLGQQYNWAVDLWSLGVVVYQLLSGASALPFDHSTDRSIVESIVNAQFDFSPASYWQSIPPSAKAFVESLLRVDPAARPSAAEALQHPWIQTRYSQLVMPPCTKYRRIQSAMAFSPEVHTFPKSTSRH